MLQLGILLTLALLVGVDQLTKWLAVSQLKGHDPFMVIPHVFSFTYTENTGAAWNLFDGQTWILVGVTSVIMIGVLIVLLSGRFRTYRMANIGGVLVVAGGLGNLIDRVVRGYVVDFIKTEFIDFPIFNFADICVSVSAVLLVVFFIFIYKEDKNFAIFANKKS